MRVMLLNLLAAPLPLAAVKEHSAEYMLRRKHIEAFMERQEGFTLLHIIEQFMEGQTPESSHVALGIIARTDWGWVMYSAFTTKRGQYSSTIAFTLRSLPNERLRSFNLRHFLFNTRVIDALLSVTADIDDA